MEVGRFQSRERRMRCTPWLYLWVNHPYKCSPLTEKFRPPVHCKFILICRVVKWPEYKQKAELFISV